MDNYTSPSYLISGSTILIHSLESYDLQYLKEKETGSKMTLFLFLTQINDRHTTYGIHLYDYVPGIP